LTPDESIGQVIGLTSSWIDLGSPDPIIADVSRQVLKLELEYAAFCGVTYILIPGPHLRGQGVTNSGVSQYARAILDAISQGPYVNLYVWMPMIDHSEEQIEQMGDLAPFSRQQYQLAEDTSTQRLDLFGTWEAWDMIRSICKYHSRLCVGKHDRSPSIERNNAIKPLRSPQLTVRSIVTTKVATANADTVKVVF
jgi:protein arginine N-methyltransferase 5